MKFANLQHLYLERILDRHFSLQEMIHLRLVSSKWNDTVQDLCRRQKSLKIFNSFNEVHGYRADLDSISRANHEDFKLSLTHDDLVLQKGAAEKIKSFHYSALRRLFPNLKKLVIANDHNDMTINVTKLVKNWPDLTTLIVFGLNFKKKLGNFWDAVESLSSLKRFHLMQTIGALSFDIPSSIFPIFKQLEHFTLVLCDYMGNCPYDMSQILANFGPNMKELVFESLPSSFREVKLAFANNRYLERAFANLTHAYFSIVIFDKNDQMSSFKFMCRKFVSLTHLTIYLDFQLCYLDMIPLLAPLKQLTELRFHVDEQKPAIKLAKLAKLPPLTTVKHLMIGYYKWDFGEKEDPKDAELRRASFFHSIPVLFPCLEQITFSNFTGKSFENNLSPYYPMLCDKLANLEKITFQCQMGDNRYGDAGYDEQYVKYASKHGRPSHMVMCG